jgi:hypothetical protein
MSETKYAVGQAVEVLTRYYMGGVYQPDGNEGTWYVVADDGTDLDLTRSESEALAGGYGTHYVSKQRIQGDPAASWRKDFVAGVSNG